ncbi:hypothetical protein Q1B84_004770 [Salmonella enterica]
MKYIKSSAIAATMIAAGFSSVYAEAADPASTTLNIHGTIVGSTCTVQFPSSVTIPDITQSVYSSAGANAQLGSDVTIGDVVFNGCNGSTVTLSAKGGSVLGGDNSKGTFEYLNSLHGTENPMIYTLGYSGGAVTGNFDLSGTAKATFTATGASFPVKQTMKVMKNGNTLTDIAKYTGNFKTRITYTADYR